MGVFVGSGTTLHVSAGLPATYDQAGYEALTFTQVKAVRSVGDMADVYETIQNRPIGGTPYRMRVGQSEKSVDLEMYKIVDDGQALLKTAVSSVTSYSYKVASPDGSVNYFTARPSSRVRGIGGGVSINDIRISLEIDSAILEL